MLERRHFILFSAILIAIIYSARLLYIQGLSVDYKQKAEKNIRVRSVEKPLRGMILDRNGKVIVGNRPVFDIFYMPKELHIEDSAAFCEFFEVDLAYVREHVKGPNLIENHFQKYQPQPFLKQLSLEDFSKIEDRLTDYPGIFYRSYTVRSYPHQSLANVLGYIKEVDAKFLEQDTSNYYRAGDLIGKSGLEKFYEKQLRGQRGVKYEMRNVKGVVKGSYMNGRFDTLPKVGKNLISSIDLDLQQYAEKLMQNKKGAVVALDPKTGEVLVILSAPSYDPNLLTSRGKEFNKHYSRLNRDQLRPLYNRAIQSPYPPGSTFKTAVALTGLQLNALDTIRTRYSCIKSLVNCHNHPGPLNVFGSIQHSCNPFYFQAYRKMVLQGGSKNEFEESRVGLDKWEKLISSFGLGDRLGVDLPYEYKGRVPSVAYYDRKYGEKRWKVGNTYSISIGQGEVGVTPIQLANLCATIANEGWYITPHLIKQIGEDGEPLPQYTQKHQVPINKAYFNHVKRAMAAVVRAGTARRAFIQDIVVCGKTGTAQNPHGKDHSVFMSFAPLDDPKIVVAAYVENSGFGGTWAAPVASLLVEKYLRENFKAYEHEKGPITRQYLEDYLTSADLIGPMMRLEGGI
ncbi:MAG: penicillin-binding protein 2 [Flammeovirgaceae bacterium]